MRAEGLARLALAMTVSAAALILLLGCSRAGGQPAGHHRAHEAEAEGPPHRPEELGHGGGDAGIGSGDGALDGDQHRRRCLNHDQHHAKGDAHHHQGADPDRHSKAG